MRVIIEGIAAFDGEYHVDDDTAWTNRELNIIKRIAGVRALEIEEALQAGDNDVLVAISICAVRQDGKDWQAYERLVWEAPAGAITFAKDEAAELDPSIPTPLPTASEPEAKPADSGPALNDDGESQEPSLRAIGGLS